MVIQVDTGLRAPGVKVSGKGSRRGRRVLAAVAGAGVAVAVAARLRSRRNQQDQPDIPADIAFMRALHAALIRDLSRLQDVAGRLGGAAAPPTVLAGWDEFRAQLENHHSAEDDDLWPVLRGELSDDGELASVDAMVEEHRQLPAALAAVDAALRGGAGLTEPVDSLSMVLVEHLAHEERDVLPLIEQHMTEAQWRAFLRKERARRSARQRPDFLAWILDGASEQDAAAVLTEMPAPVGVVYRRVLQPRYEAQHRWEFPRPADEGTAAGEGNEAG
jgi:hemerythrin-like domain-containing protein